VKQQLKGKGKGTDHSIAGHEGQQGVGGQRHTPAALPQGMTRTHSTGGCPGAEYHVLNAIFPTKFLYSFRSFHSHLLGQFD
jgi:hypothetical protein